MKVQLHTPLAMGHARDEVTELHTTPPHVYFDADGRAELRWSASDNAAHSHNRIVRVALPKEQADAWRALVARKTREAFGQLAEEPARPTEPPPTFEEGAAWEPPEAPRKDGKPWTPPGVTPEPIEEDESEHP